MKSSTFDRETDFIFLTFFIAWLCLSLSMIQSKRSFLLHSTSVEWCRLLQLLGAQGTVVSFWSDILYSKDYCELPKAFVPTLRPALHTQGCCPKLHTWDCLLNFKYLWPWQFNLLFVTFWEYKSFCNLQTYTWFMILQFLKICKL